jgi:predicted amidohydrolase YtcJ
VGTRSCPSATDLSTGLGNYTRGSARVNGVDDRAGSIEEGYGADLSVVDADLGHLDAAEIHAASVRQSWVGGRLAYERA